MGEHIKVQVQRRGYPSEARVYEQTEVTIGRVRGNDVTLDVDGADERHARIVLRDQKLILVDLRSASGTFLNKRRITSPTVLKAKDWIQIGNAQLRVSTSDGESAFPGGVAEESADRGSTDVLLDALDRLLD